MNVVKQPLQKRAINTKNAILDAAFASFLKNGYKLSSTKLIAQNAKVSVGIIYNYYKDKDELLKLWLEDLLHRGEDYFYNQFRLRDYDVEMTMIAANILEKLTDTFFSSPIIFERDSAFINDILDTFYDDGKKLFIKCCDEANLLLKNPRETAQILLNLVLAFNTDLKTINQINPNVLKHKYTKLIADLMSNN